MGLSVMLQPFWPHPSPLPEGRSLTKTSQGTLLSLEDRTIDNSLTVCFFFLIAEKSDSLHMKYHTPKLYLEADTGVLPGLHSADQCCWWSWVALKAQGVDACSLPHLPPVWSDTTCGPESGKDCVWLSPHFHLKISVLATDRILRQNIFCSIFHT